MPKTFSQLSMTFDHDPSDSELSCLLGDSDAGPIKVVETNGISTVSPKIFPMKYLVPWMIFICTIMTGMTYFGSQNKHGNLEPISIGMIALIWLIGVPSILGFLYLINTSFAKKGDYFKYDSHGRTLELCQVGRVIAAEEIVAFTELIRWHIMLGGTCDETCQSDVLVRNENSTLQLYPLARGIDLPIFYGNSGWADRLAGIYEKPVRRIQLSKAESLAL